MVELDEIVFCDLTIIHKKIKHILERIVYRNDGDFFYNKNILEKIKIKEPVKVLDVKIISRLGFKNKNK